MTRNSWLRWTLLAAGIGLALSQSDFSLAKDKGRGGDRGNSSSGAQQGAQRSFEGAGQSRGNFSGGSNNFDKSRSSGARSLESRGIQPRNFDAQKFETRNFDARNLDTRKFDTQRSGAGHSSSSDLSNRIKSGNVQPRRVESFRPPTNTTNRQFQFEKPTDGVRSGAGRTATPRNFPNNDAAADTIRKAQERLGGNRLDASKGPKVDRQKLDTPNFEKPKFDRPTFANPDGRSGAIDRVKRPDNATHDHSKIDKFSRDNLPDRSGQFDHLPENARKALEKANLPRDLKLGTGKTATDVRKNLGLDSDKFDHRHRDPTDFDRDRISTHRHQHGQDPHASADRSKRDRYDMQHHRIGHDGAGHDHHFDDATAAKWSKQHWLDKTDRSHYDKFVKNAKFEQYHLDRQYHLHDRGDVARRLDLHQNFVDHGGWQHRHVGHVSPQYRNHCSYRNYWGPSWYPQRCWYPSWNNWVSWSWGFHCNPWYDPRPSFCRPAIYDPCQRWVFWQYPVWQPLPVVAAGTWVDVPQVMVDEGFDVRLLAVRFVDPGHFEQGLGQRYRVWLRNDSNRNIDRPINVVMMGTNDLIPGDRRLEVGQRVPSIAAGQTLAIDMRLPLSPDRAGEPMPFEKLHVLVDANRELNDVEMTNNGAVIEREEVMPVDPAAFNIDADVATAGQVITIAGEGLGPEPGQILLQVGNETYQPEILGWYDLGVQVRLPAVNANGMADGDLVVVRGDGAATNPLAIQIAGAQGGREF